MSITASKIYDYIQCPHKVWRDIHGPQEERSKEVNPFVQLLWDRGVAHEENILKGLGKYVDIGKGSLEERSHKTLEAMKAGEPLIYQGVIKYNNLLGIPDLLRKLPDGNYVPMDIKSGAGMEGADEDSGEEGKPKKHYAFQLCVYSETLIGVGFAKDKKGYIIDGEGKTVEYLLDEWWEKYEQTKNEVQNLMENKYKNLPAYGGVCKLCPWYESCKKWCKETNDLSNIFYLGRGKRDRLNGN
jgi:predicted RecB family nuclease